MRYVCDAPGGKTWFRIETEGEAVAESEAMHHAVEKYFRKEHERAAAELSAIVEGQFRAGNRPEGAYPARDAAVPDVARR